MTTQWQTILTQVWLVEPGKLQDVDGAHRVVHHKLHGVLDRPINMWPRSKVEDEINRPDIFSHLIINGGPEISKHNLDPLSGLRIFVLKHVVDPVEVAGEVKTIQADDIPVRAVQQPLNDMMSNKSGPSSHQSCLFNLLCLSTGGQ